MLTSIIVVIKTQSICQNHKLKTKIQIPNCVAWFVSYLGRATTLPSKNR